MTAEPARTPVTVTGLPEDPTVATEGLLLDQCPPPVVSFSVVVWPWHTRAIPPIPVGAAFTVAMAVVRQVVGNV